jgi:hypothetical protein
METFSESVRFLPFPHFHMSKVSSETQSQGAQWLRQTHSQMNVSGVSAIGCPSWDSLPLAGMQMRERSRNDHEV